MALAAARQVPGVEEAVAVTAPPGVTEIVAVELPQELVTVTV